MKISRENSEWGLENSGKRIYYCNFMDCDDYNSREFQKRVTPDFDKNGNFGGPRKIWNFWNFGHPVNFLGFMKFQKKSSFLLNSG